MRLHTFRLNDKKSNKEMSGIVRAISAPQRPGAFLFVTKNTTSVRYGRKNMAPLTRSRAKTGTASKSSKTAATAPKKRARKPKASAAAAAKKTPKTPASPKTASPPKGRIVTPKLAKTPSPKTSKGKGKGKRKAKSPEPAQPVSDDDESVNADDLRVTPTDGPAYGRYLASNPARLGQGSGRFNGPSNVDEPTLKFGQNPKTPKKSKGKGNRKAKTPEPTQPPLSDNESSVNGDDLLAVPENDAGPRPTGDSFARHLLNNRNTASLGPGSFNPPPRNAYAPGERSALDEWYNNSSYGKPGFGTPFRPGADGMIARARRNFGIPVTAGFSPLVGPLGPMLADYISLEGPGLARGAGRRTVDTSEFPIYAPGGVGAVLPRPEVSPLDRPTRRTARDRVATPTAPQYAPVAPRRRSTRSSVAESPSANFPPAPPPSRRRPSVATPTPTPRPARRPPPRGASVARPGAAAAENQRGQRPPIMQPLRPRPASTQSVSPTSPRPRRPRHGNRRGQPPANPNTAPSYIPLADSNLTPNANSSQSTYVTAPSHQSSPNPNPTEHALPHQLRFRQPLTRDPITPRRFQRELQRLQNRLVTDPAEVNAIRRSRVESRMARAARAVARERRREEEMRGRARERQRVWRREREVERERDRVDERDARLGVSRGNGPVGLGISGVPGL